MASVYLVSPELVQKKANNLLARVRRSRGTEKVLYEWIERMDATEALLQPSLAEQSNPEAAVEPSTALGEPNTIDR